MGPITLFIIKPVFGASLGAYQFLSVSQASKIRNDIFSRICISKDDNVLDVYHRAVTRNETVLWFVLYSH